MATIGQVVKDLRTRKHLSQSDIARLSRNRLGTSWLASLETDRIANPAPEKLEILVSLLGTSVLEVYARAGVIELPEGLSPEERRAVDQFRKLSAREKAAVMNLMASLSSGTAVESLEAEEQAGGERAAGSDHSGAERRKQHP